MIEPTIGFDKQTIEFEGRSFSICELGSPLLPNFHKYIPKSRAIIFMVDYQDELQIAEAAGWFSLVMQSLAADSGVGATEQTQQDNHLTTNFSNQMQSILLLFNNFPGYGATAEYVFDVSQLLFSNRALFGTHHALSSAQDPFIQSLFAVEQYT